MPVPTDTYAPKLRGAHAADSRARVRPTCTKGGARKAPRKQVGVPQGLRNAAVLSGIAVAATGVTVASGVVLGDNAGTNQAIALSGGAATDISAADIAERVQRTSRSAEDRAAGVDATKVAALSNASGAARAGVEDLSTADPKTIAKALLS